MGHKSPAFQFYPDSWLSSKDILLMTPAEEGAYIHLLSLAWLEDDCGLPNDDEALAILSRLGRKWEKSSHKLRAKFRAENGRLYNDRLLVERCKQEEWRRKSSEGGKRSAEVRHEANLKGGAMVVEEWCVPKGNSSSPSPSLVTTSDIVSAKADTPSTGVEDVGAATKHSVIDPPFFTLGKVKSRPAILPEIFQWFAGDFWPAYPRRVGKAAALKAANKMARTPETRTAIMAGLLAQLPELNTREAQHIPHASTWLNQERWNDEPEKPIAPPLSRSAAKRAEVREAFERMMGGAGNEQIHGS